MKKRITSFVLIIAVLIGAASASVMRDLRWAYFNTSSVGIEKVGNSIEWSGDASTYTVSAVTSTKVVLKLQVSTGVGWGTVETLTGTDKNDAGAIGYYSNWKNGESYRVALEAWAYNGTKELEHIGPFYDYLNT